MATDEQLDQWVAALRSGKYTQTTGVFRDGTCYCAVGVFLDTLDPEGWYLDDEGDYGHYSDGKLRRYFCGRAQILVENWNDHDGKSFEEIAELLDERRDEFTGQTDLYGD